MKTRARADKSETRELPTGYRMARVTAFGVSNVAPSGAVVGGLVIVVGTRVGGSAGRPHRPGGVSVLRGQHRGVRPAAAVRRLAVHLP